MSVKPIFRHIGTAIHVGEVQYLRECLWMHPSHRVGDFTALEGQAISHDGFLESRLSEQVANR